MRTGMEPLFNFCEKVRYAFQEIGKQWKLMRQYETNIRNWRPRND